MSRGNRKKEPEVLAQRERLDSTDLGRKSAAFDSNSAEKAAELQNLFHWIPSVAAVGSISSVFSEDFDGFEFRVITALFGRAGREESVGITDQVGFGKPLCRTSRNTFAATNAEIANEKSRLFCATAAS